MCPVDILASITDLPWLLPSVPRLFDCFRLNTTFHLLRTLAAMQPRLITSETETAVITVKLLTYTCDMVATADRKWFALLLRLLSSGMWLHVIRWKLDDMSEEHIAIILRIGEHTKFIPDHSITAEKTLNEDYFCWVVISCRLLFIDCLTLFWGLWLKSSLGTIHQCWYYDYTVMNTSSFCKSHWEVFVLHPSYVMIIIWICSLQMIKMAPVVRPQWILVPFSFQ